MCFPLGLKPLLLTFLIFPPVSFSDYLVFFFLSFARKTNILDTIYSSKTTYTVGAHLNDKLCYNLARKSPVYSMKELETVLMFNSIRWLSETLRRDELSLFLPLFYMVFCKKKKFKKCLHLQSHWGDRTRTLELKCHSIGITSSFVGRTEKTQLGLRFWFQCDVDVWPWVRCFFFEHLEMKGLGKVISKAPPLLLYTLVVCFQNLGKIIRSHRRQLTGTANIGGNWAIPMGMAPF